MTLPAICPEWCAADHGEAFITNDLEHFSQVRAIGRDVIVEIRQEFGADSPTVHVGKGWGDRWVDLTRAEAEAVAAAIGALLAV